MFYVIFVIMGFQSCNELKKLDLAYATRKSLSDQNGLHQSVFDLQPTSGSSYSAFTGPAVYNNIITSTLVMSIRDTVLLMLYYIRYCTLILLICIKLFDLFFSKEDPYIQKVFGRLSFIAQLWLFPKYAVLK